MIYVYTHIDLVLFIFIKSGTFCIKSGAFHEKYMKSTWKTTKTADSTQVSHFDLVFHRVQREGQLGISYILLLFGGACGACVCKWCMYTHILTPDFVGFHETLATFCMKPVVFFMKSMWKALKSIWKSTETADSTQVSYFDLVFHRVNREGQLGICYILVIFGDICIHTY